MHSKTMKITYFLYQWVNLCYDEANLEKMGKQELQYLKMNDPETQK